MTVLENKLNELKERIFEMAALVETMLSSGIKGLVQRQAVLCSTVIAELEPRVNQLEIANDETAIGLIALHQPEASNLRTIVSCLKLTSDLERIGDHAVNISEAALFLIDRPEVKPLIDLPRMATETVSMLHDSLDAFVRSQPEQARAVCRRDSVVDDLKDRIIRELVEHMQRDGATVERALKLIMITLNLERVADLATNIAEASIYVASGEDIKHCQQDDSLAGEGPESLRETGRE